MTYRKSKFYEKMGLEDYKDLVATSAMITTMGHMLSGTLICKDIYRKGTSKGVDPMPFMGGVGMCTLMLRYALMLQDPTMINVNVFGLLTNIAYVAVFYCFAPQRNETHTLIAKVAAFVTVFLVYAHLEDSGKIEFRFGLITTVLLLLLIGSPLVHLAEIIKTKNTDILPFPLIFMGTLVSFQWLLYGLIIGNGFIIFQNVVGFALCVVQMSLFVIFPSNATGKSPKKEK